MRSMNALALGLHVGLPAGIQHTRSASESSSWPISDAFFRHLATLPSMKSKKRPNGMKANAAHRLPKSSGLPRQ